MGALLENYYDRPQQRGQLRRAGLRAGPGHRHPKRLPAVGALRRPGHNRAVPPGPRRGLRLPGGGPDARQPAVSRRAQLGGVPAGHRQRPGPVHHGRHGARVRLRSSRHLGHRSHSDRSRSESRKGRSVRRPPRRVRVLPLGHREPGLLRRAHPVVPAAARRPDPGRHHPGVLLDLAEPVRRRPPRTLRHRRPGRGWRRPTRSWRSGCRRSWSCRPTGTAA